MQVSETGTALSQASDQAVPSGNASDTGSMTTNPSYYRNLRISQNSFRSTVSDSEIEAGNVSFIGDILIVLLIIIFFLTKEFIRSLISDIICPKIASVKYYTNSQV